MNITNKQNFLIIAFLLFITVSGYSQSTMNAEKINYYNTKVVKYLDKKRALSPFYSINEKGVSIYSSSQNKTNKNAEYFIAWTELENFKTLLKTTNNDEAMKLLKLGKLATVGISSKNNTQKNVAGKKLKGLKIAIDPGHTAGEMETALIEAKCLQFQCTNAKGEKCNIAISEGVLTFAVATLLKNKLEAEGAQVFMTRTFNGGTAYGMTFNNFLKPTVIDSLYKKGELSQKQKAILLNPKINKRAKFQSVFKNLELQKRGEIINNYHPDITAVIHFNVDEKNTGWKKPGAKNYNMAFVGGAFMPSDMSSSEKRFEFLRLLISDDVENSIDLSADVLNHFEKHLNVKTASYNDAKYLVEGCLPADKAGVYCRNLQLTRYIHGPLVYGETLYQDNINECISLNQETDKTKNQRIQQVAEAYFQGILEYVDKK